MIVGLQLVSALVSASILFLLAAGLSLIFGVCRVMNLAHGSFFMLTTFLAFSFTRLLVNSPWGFWLALLLAPLLVAALGSLIEITVFRRVYGTDLLIQLLPTIAIIYILGDTVRFFWGLIGKTIPTPSAFKTAVSVMGVAFPSYYGFMIAVGAFIAFGLWYLVYRTRWGILVRAIAQDREMSTALGINEGAIYTTVFSLGVWLAGVAGVLSAPIAGAALGADMDATIEAFVVVVVGGLGSIPGSLLAALLIALVKAFGILIFPQFAMAFVFGLMALVLILRPTGLLGRKEH
jgi:branched-subunit amino acid ABC-type transport system permease component